MECFSKMALDLTGLTVVGVELENLKTPDPKIEYVVPSFGQEGERD